MVAKEISFPDFLRAVAIPMFGFATLILWVQPSWGLQLEKPNQEMLVFCSSL